MNETPGCPSFVACETICRGKGDARVPTKVTVVEFKNNADREKALTLLTDKQLKDKTGASIVCKRAKTASQRDRNFKLQKAEEEVKKLCKSSQTVKIEWKDRQILCNGVPAFIQNKDDSSGIFLPPFEKIQW